MSNSSSSSSGSTALLARRYSDALFELALESNKVDAVALDVATLSLLLEKSTEFQFFTQTPLLSREIMVTLMRLVAVAAGLGTLTGNFLALLAANRRLSKLSVILDAFQTKLSAHRGETRVLVTTARPLTPTLQGKLETMLRYVTGGKVRVNAEVKPEIMGGVVMKYGTRQIDASVRGKLARLERQLRSQQEVA